MCFGRGFPFVLLAGWATVVVLVAAVTTWWVLFALVPLAMMLNMTLMMGAMARSARGAGAPAAWPWAWCRAFFAPADDAGPGTSQQR